MPDGFDTPAADRSFQLQLQGYRLVTAEILYRLPDAPSLLQSYLWQELDLVPKLPGLRKFLDFWQAELDGQLYRVRVAARQDIVPVGMGVEQETCL